MNDRSKAGVGARLKAWLAAGNDPGAEGHEHVTMPWYKVLWLTGVDYFSTLGYQPGIALLAAGAIAPLATSLLVLITLFGAVPMYRAVARRSYRGQGSISMLERQLTGWYGKLLLLGLIGFAATAFVITMTLSAADAALHVVENPIAQSVVGHAQVPLTIAMLVVLGIIFLRGFREAIGIAAWMAVPYLLLNCVIIGHGVQEIVAHPEHLARWKAALAVKGDPGTLAMLAVLAFPSLALGLSGFETGVTVMPLVKGDDSDPPEGPPRGRIRATEHLLVTAALIMSGLLIGSSFVTTLLIPEEAWREGGPAAGRALAWLAHTHLGAAFGTAYDISTILILWFAGASAMAALLNIIPQYLPRFGMAPQWVGDVRPLILVITGINILVTIGFGAGVEEQGGAYATGVLALFLSAAVAVALAMRAEARAVRAFPWGAIPYGVIALIFAYTLVANVIERPDGLFISSAFILAVLVLGAASRYSRATELRVEHARYANAESEELFDELRGKGVHIVTVRDAAGVLDQTRRHVWEQAKAEHAKAETASADADQAKAAFAKRAIFTGHKQRIQDHYKVSGSFCFIHVDLDPDESRFGASLSIRMRRVGDDYVMEVKNASAVANAIAWVSQEVRPRSVFLGLTQEPPMRQALQYLLWGKGETGILVYQILLKCWETLPDDAPRPTLYLMSDARRHPAARG